ncbi:MAG: hypothetical protein AAFN70_07750, partial [Planctomycetota bacterium]
KINDESNDSNSVLTVDPNMESDPSPDTPITFELEIDQAFLCTSDLSEIAANPGTYNVVLVTPSSSSTLRNTGLSFQVVPDPPPIVRIDTSFPAAGTETLATRSAAIPLEISARDDALVTSLQLNVSAPLRLSAALPASSIAASAVFRVPADAEIDSTIEIIATAKDNAGNTTNSRPVRLRLVTPQQFQQRMAQRRKDVLRQIETAIEDLSSAAAQQRIANLDDDDSQSGSDAGEESMQQRREIEARLRSAASTLTGRPSSAANTLREIAERSRQNQLPDASYSRDARSIQSAADDVSDAGNALQSRQTADIAESKLESAIETLQRVASTMGSRASADAMQQELQRVTDTQSAIARATRANIETANRSNRRQQQREIANQQRALARQTDALAQRMRSMNGNLNRDEPPDNPDSPFDTASDQLQDQQFSDQMRDAADQLSEGDASKSADDQSRIAQQLRNLQNQLDQDRSEDVNRWRSTQMQRLVDQQRGIIDSQSSAKNKSILQVRIASQTTSMGNQLKALPLFESVLDSLGEQMAGTASQLRSSEQPIAPTIDKRMRQHLDTLESLADALDSDLREPSENADSQSSSTQPNPQQEDPTDPTASGIPRQTLLLLKLMQDKIYQDTQSAWNDPNPDTERQADISRRQNELESMINGLIQGRSPQ